MWTTLVRDAKSSESIQGINRPTFPSVQHAVGEEVSKEFAGFMRQILTPGEDQKVSEEELFAALIQNGIKETKGEEALKKFQEILTKEKASLQKPDGFIPWEDAARSALKKFTAEGGLTKEEADKIHTNAFNGAQIDGNTDVLFDDRGGPGDPTMAVTTMEAALIAMHQKLDGYARGLATPESRPLDAIYASGRVAPAATHSGGSSSVSGPSRNVDGVNGFLFKPVSDTTGKLVVLLPNFMTGEVARVSLRDSKGKEIEGGRYSGVGNGEREHYRFNRSGGDYERNITVRVEMKDGSVKRYRIKDPSMRHD